MDNYTGPGWSDGRVQWSRKFGASKPKDYLDSQSRLHDTAYAHFKDNAHRRAADVIYERNLRHEGGIGGAISALPLYGNYALTRAQDIATNVGGGLVKGGAIGAVGGLVRSGINYVGDMNDWLQNREKYVREVEELYRQDPMYGNMVYYPKPRRQTTKIIPKRLRGVPETKTTSGDVMPPVRSNPIDIPSPSTKLPFGLPPVTAAAPPDDIDTSAPGDYNTWVGEMKQLSGDVGQAITYSRTGITPNVEYVPDGAPYEPILSDPHVNEPLQSNAAPDHGNVGPSRLYNGEYRAASFLLRGQGRRRRRRQRLTKFL